MASFLGRMAKDALSRLTALLTKHVLRLTALLGYSPPTIDRRSLPVLCFGDSITEGYHGVWQHPEFSPAANTNENEISNVRFHPYAVRLGHLLAADAADAAEGYKAALRYACVRAYSGWTAEELTPQLNAALRERPWRAACVLAGTNDAVLAGVDAATTLARIQRLHEACDAAGVPVVVLTPPDADLAHHGLVPAEEAAQRRTVITEVADGLIRTSKKSGRALADVRAALPLCAAFFDDCLHPSPDGYDRMADVIHDALHRHGL